MSSPMDRLLENCEWRKVEWTTPPGCGLPYVTHEGVLKIGGMEIPCATLSDGQRILTGPMVDELMRLLEELSP